MKLCDYALFVEHSQGIDVFLCELKKTLGRGCKGEGAKQINVGFLFYDILCLLLKVHCGMIKNVKERYFLIAQKRDNTNKKRTHSGRKLETFTSDGINIEIIISTHISYVKHMRKS